MSSDAGSRERARRPHVTHFGVLEAWSDGRTLHDTRGWRRDPDPRDVILNVPTSQHHPTRVRRPAVRRGWLENGPGGVGRGDEPFVEVSWDHALDLLASELTRVYEEHGSSGVYGGSYGWSSAGRFHHGQSQLHRFLNCAGGYVSAVGDYSYGASGALLPHLVGDPTQLMADATTWDVIFESTELFLAFGGLSEKNTAIGPGGVGKHDTRDAIRRARAAGCRFVDITPIRDDTFAEAEASWWAVRPGSDAALMLAFAYVLEIEDLVDRGFLRSHTVGYERFVPYLLGERDGVPKTPEWAAAQTDLPAADIRDLARLMARSRTLINVSWSMQRQPYGEQPIWLALTLAAMIGQIGLPGGGFQHGYGSSADVGHARRVLNPPAFPAGRNPETRSIPVARLSDMLLEPGSVIPFNGSMVELPLIDLVYWVGGNPFHHHQDLAKLRRAWTRPSTVVVHEQFWTSTARHADIVLPATMTVERDDFGSGRNDPFLFPMPALTDAVGEARDDYAIFAGLESRMRLQRPFTEGRTVQDWLRHLYGGWRERLAGLGHEVPDFDTFWASDFVELPVVDARQVLHAGFRENPDAYPLPTPSGRIEIYSERIDSFGYDDCPGHPVWREPAQWLGRHEAEWPLQLIANQPKTRLHSQLDVGATSQAAKVRGREPLRMHPRDATARGLVDGDVVVVRNERGSCLAGLVVSDAVRPGVVQLSAGAWYDPDPADPSFCRHGNPNVLTSDAPASALSQATTAMHAMVEVSSWDGPLPDCTVLDPPPMTADVQQRLARP